MRDKPPFVRAAGHLGKLDRVRTRQLQTLMSVDDLVQAVFMELTKLHEATNTLAFFLSDNGYLWGEHRLVADKRWPYTESVGVPLLVRWPGHFPSGAVDERLAANIDVAPTIVQAAGLPSGQDLDGRSLLKPTRRTQLLLEYWSAYGNVPGWASLRTSSYQYTEYYMIVGRSRVTFREYYDLSTDPDELVNLLHDGTHANDPDVGALHAALVRASSCHGTSGPVACP